MVVRCIGLLWLCGRHGGPRRHGHHYQPPVPTQTQHFALPVLAPPCCISAAFHRPIGSKRRNCVPANTPERGTLRTNPPTHLGNSSRKLDLSQNGLSQNGYGAHTHTHTHTRTHTRTHTDTHTHTHAHAHHTHTYAFRMCTYCSIYAQQDLLTAVTDHSTVGHTQQPRRYVAQPS
jgi:hypothetical protein